MKTTQKLIAFTLLLLAACTSSDHKAHVSEGTIEEMTELTEIISELYYTCQFTQKAAFKTIKMDWNRETGKSYIIDKIGSFDKSTFSDFVINAYYFQLVC